jgi:hypothetical protein
MKRIVDLAAGVVGTPVLALFLKYLGLAALQPLGAWDFPVDVIAFVSAVVGGMIANYYPRANAARRAWTVTLAGAWVAMLACVFVYYVLSSSPPPRSVAGLHNAACFVTYFGFFFAFGYCLTHVVRYLTAKAAKKK